MYALTQIQEIKGFTSLLSKTDAVMNNTNNTNGLLREAVAELTEQVRKSDEQSTYLDSSVSLLAMQIPLLTEQLKETKAMQHRAIQLSEAEKIIHANQLYAIIRNWYPEGELRQLRITNDTIMRDSAYRMSIINEAQEILKAGALNKFLLSDVLLTSKWLKAINAVAFLKRQFVDANALFAKQGRRDNPIGLPKIYSVSVYMSFERTLTYCSETKQEVIEYILRTAPHLKYADSLGITLKEVE